MATIPCLLTDSAPPIKIYPAECRNSYGTAGSNLVRFIIRNPMNLFIVFSHRNDLTALVITAVAANPV